MANNRTEAKSATTSALVPTLTLAQLITLWNNELNDSYIFEKDIIASETEAGGNVTINYANKDTATVTTAVNLTVSFTNLENGAVKYLEITKAATNTVSFAGATDVSISQNTIDTTTTLVTYEIFNKNGSIYVRALLLGIIDIANIPNLSANKITSDELAAARLPQATTTAKGASELATQTEVNTGTDTVRIVTPDTLRDTTFVAAQIPSLSANKITTDTFGAARIPIATESAIGALEIATTAEAELLSAADKIITPSTLADVNGKMLTKIVNIGDWNMNDSAAGSFSISVAHGVTDFEDIRRVTAFIRNDADSIHYDLNGVSGTGADTNGGIGSIDGTNVLLIAKIGSLFDTTTFDATSYNRGFMIIDYIQSSS